MAHIWNKIVSLFLNRKNIVLSTTITGVLIALLLSWLLADGFLEKYLHVSPYSYMNYFFSQSNKPGTEVIPIKGNANIIIYSPKDFNELSAKRLAGVIDTLASLKPRCLAFDMLYESGISDNSQLKEQILKSIEKCECPVIFPSVVYHGDNGNILYKNSFFIDKPMCSASVPDYWKFSRYDNIDKELERFPYAVAKESGYLQNKLNKQSAINSFIPDFRWKDFPKINSIKGCSSANIKDHIVLIGNVNDFKDLKPIPFQLEGNMEIPGIILNAYLVDSLISTAGGNENPFRKCFLLDLVLCFILFYLYSLGIHWISNRIEESERKAILILLIIVKFVFILGIEFIAYFICSKITSFSHFVFNMIILLISCLLLDSVYTCFKKICK